MSRILLVIILIVSFGCQTTAGRGKIERVVEIEGVEKVLVEKWTGITTSLGKTQGPIGMESDHIGSAAANALVSVFSTAIRAALNYFKGTPMSDNTEEDNTEE